jgi:hypothetical protein
MTDNEIRFGISAPFTGSTNELGNQTKLGIETAFRMLFFGALTGAKLLRRTPPDRYVFKYRASYVEETDAVVHYLVKVRHLRPERIVVFAQHDLRR